MQAPSGNHNLYVWIWTHEHGADSGLCWATDCPTVDQIVVAFKLDFEPDLSETIDIAPVTMNKILSIGA